jgi:transposase
MSRGGLGTKIHVRVDALGNPVQVELSAGQRHDYALAKTLTKDVHDANLIADLGYEGNDLLAQLADQRCIAVIPPRHHRKNPWTVDAHLYKERHLVECFFQKLKRNRRVAMRFEKLATNFLAMVLLASILIWLA